MNVLLNCVTQNGKLQEQLDGERQSQRSGSSSKLTVSEEDVAEVVASWTNIPLRKLTEGESKRLIHLEEWRCMSVWSVKMRLLTLLQKLSVEPEPGLRIKTAL